MIHEDIFIRNEEDRMAFVYTVRKGAVVIASGTVGVDEEVVSPGYYGGSEAMD
jgi:hypothetical protein